MTSPWISGSTRLSAAGARGSPIESRPTRDSQRQRQIVEIQYMSISNGHPLPCMVQEDPLTAPLDGTLHAVKLEYLICTQHCSAAM